MTWGLPLVGRFLETLGCSRASNHRLLGLREFNQHDGGSQGWLWRIGHLRQWRLSISSRYRATLRSSSSIGPRFVDVSCSYTCPVLELYCCSGSSSFAFYKRTMARNDRPAKYYRPRQAAKFTSGCRETRDTWQTTWRICILVRHNHAEHLRILSKTST